MITRILSVFRFLKRVGFAILLLLGGSAYAQPFDVLWDRSGQGPESGYGAYVFSLGDQNNDGFMDWGVNSQGGVPGDPSESLTEFFYGGNPPQTIPYHVWLADPEIHLNYLFVEPVGDLNNDEYVDWQVSYWLLNSQPATEEVQIHFGGPDADFIPKLVLYLPFSQSRLFGMGDFNGDGFDDMFVRDPDNLPHTRVLFGAMVLDSIPDLTTEEFIRAYPFGDLNGDGFADFLDSDENVYLGSESPDLVPEYHWEGGNDGMLGRILPDINGDGKDDFAASDLTIPGRINVFFGSDVLSTVPDGTIEFGDNCPHGGLDDIVGLGDINDDWHNDFAVIQRDCINSWGGIHIFLGYRWINSEPIASIRGRTEPYQLVGIFSAAGLGDVDGNGTGDFAIGAWNDDFDGERGRVVIMSGDTSYVVPVGAARPELPNALSLSVYPNPFNSSTMLQINAPRFTGTVELGIYNVLGQLVHADQVALSASVTRVHLYLPALSSGNYFLRLVSPSEFVTTPLIVLK